MRVRIFDSAGRMKQQGRKNHGTKILFIGGQWFMAGRGRRSRCSLQRRPRRDGEEAHLGFEWLRAPLVRPTWLSELSAQQRAHRANWALRARPRSKEARVALSAPPLKRLLEPGELRLRQKDHANVAVASTCVVVCNVQPQISITRKKSKFC